MELDRHDRADASGHVRRFPAPAGAGGNDHEADPHGYMVEAINQGMSGSATLSSVAIDLGVLAVTSLAAFGAVIWFLRRERQ